jgi:hypothetical protein
MMELKDWLLLGATAAGPILAVQAQKFVERFREQRGRKLRIFNTLMATRAAKMSVDHVKALNMIDLVFYGSWRGRTKKEQTILNAWKEYLDHLNSWKSEADGLLWSSTAEELFLNLLAAIAADAGFSFDRVQLKRGAYFPKGHGDYEQDNLLTRKAWLEIVEGKRPLRMEITNIPPVSAPPRSPSLPP